MVFYVFSEFRGFSCAFRFSRVFGFASRFLFVDFGVGCFILLLLILKVIEEGTLEEIEEEVR